MMNVKYLDQTDLKEISDFCLKLMSGISESLPPVLWHYTTAEGFIGIIEERKFRASHITAMNDANEYRYSVEALLQAAQKRIHQQQNTSAELEALRIRMCLELSRTAIPDVPPIFVSCFTADVDRANHWGEYGARGKGYALGFATIELLRIAFERGILALPCVYNEGVISAIMENVIFKAEEIFTKVLEKNRQVTCAELIENFLSVYFWNLTYLAPAFKHATFSHESEWRFTRRLANHDYANMTFVGRGAEIRPYIELDFSETDRENISRIPLTHVVIGPARSNLDFELAELAVKGMLSKFGYVGINTVRSESPYRG